MSESTEKTAELSLMGRTSRALPRRWPGSLRCSTLNVESLTK